MRRPHTLLAALLLAAGTAAAQDYGQAATLKIWDNTTAPHSNGIATPEREPEPNRIADVSQAVLYIFPADPAKATGQAVVICPGGGYVKLCIDYEGYDMAKWFAANGITAAVLKYRMPNGHPEVPLEDVEQALRIMMGLEAGATGFTAGKVGIVGSSAGGHLAASASTLAETKPAFSILFYPVITAEKGKGHQGSFNALLGGSRNAESDTWYSLQNRVTAQTPPTLLLLSDDDKVVPPVNSTLYYNALKEHGVKASMHIYPTGGHGWATGNAGLAEKAERSIESSFRAPAATRPARLRGCRDTTGHKPQKRREGTRGSRSAGSRTGVRPTGSFPPGVGLACGAIISPRRSVTPFFQTTHCRLTIIAYLCRQNKDLWQTTAF